MTELFLFVNLCVAVVGCICGIWAAFFGCFAVDKGINTLNELVGLVVLVLPSGTITVFCCIWLWCFWDFGFKPEAPQLPDLSWEQ